MTINLYAVIAVVILLITLELLRRSFIREKYALVWFLISGVLFVTSIFPGPIFALSYSLGFKTPSNFIFSTLIFLLLILVIQLSTAISRIEDKIQILAEEVALINAKKKLPNSES